MPCLKAQFNFYESYLQVMANLTQQIMEFAMSLPPSTNPYEATAALIRKETDAA
ncbi:hypothetical protein PCANC_03126 [Puccinia coronata f. sp. avenae]|uniref:Uncharacterized protein n=1 Tax=Puccinia coronata f. sp. avenae TaxID=200324 RepID=A0A2N5W4M5_9BASI|nr:hypothetical protein PCANC_03126 [Puccinia coronata f. sp. avenae]